MKKTILSMLAIICIAGNSIAQKETKYKKVFYKTQTIENTDVKVTIDNAVATPAGVKFKIKIINKTTDYIIYKPSESVFKIKGKDNKPEEKWLIVRPNDNESQVIDLKGPDYLIAENFDFVLDGLYKVSINAKGSPAPDFKLPASQNDFKAGGFSVTLDKVKKETARTDAKFKVAYTGDQIGIFEPNKVVMKMPDGKEYANYHSDNRPLIFNVGTLDDFTVSWKDIPTTSGDMQKVDMQILWKDAFKEVTPTKIPALNLTILFDKETSDAKGK
jgi:hypothetical protein